jgi:hypothetical protein
MIDGPQPYGNAAGGPGDLAYPTGGHYLPLPSPESTHVREILFDLGIIQRDPMAEKPTYDERYILHAPEERLLFNGQWQDGFIPTEGVPPGNWRSTSASLPSAAPAPDAWQRWQARLRVPHRGIVAGPGLAGAR